MTSNPKTLSQESHDARRVDVITDQMAMQHELETLRSSLSAKSKKLEAISTAFRELEDRLEDQHHTYDKLRKRYRSSKRALNAVLKKLVRLQRQHADGQASASRADLVRPPQKGSEATNTEPVSPASTSSISFLWGLAAGIFMSLLVAGVAVCWWYPDLLSSQFRPQLPIPQAVEPVSKEADTKAAEEYDSGTAVPAPMTPRILRDRFRGGAGPLMAVVPPGEFSMGTRGFVPGSGEHPAHRVEIRGFLIGVNEVTFAEYDRFVRATGRRPPKDFGWGRDRRPVVDVSWMDARDYSQWLSGQTGRRYRLPTEAEWEYAARAGSQSAYWWGHDLDPSKALCFDCRSALGNRSTVPVGTFTANPFGLNDTAGNVMEWVQDCYHPSYTDAPTDGQAREDGPCAERVARGGAFNKPSKSLRSAARHRFAPDTRIDMIGFRLARDN